ncbi:MAG: type II secretion system protein [Phycisphaerales bacterium]
MMTCRAAHNDRRRGARRANGFTIVETLLVIAIVGLLASLSLLVGRGVIAQTKVRQTKQILTTLDSIITEYQAEYQSIPPYTGGGATNPLHRYLPPDGWIDEGSYTYGDVRPEAAVFIAQARGLAGVDSLLATIPSEFLVSRNIPEGAWEDGDPKGASLYPDAQSDGLSTMSGTLQRKDPRLTVRDAWGMEILYIHPDNEEAVSGEGADLADWEGYGEPKNRRPYFLSAGPDLIYYAQAEIDGSDEIVGMQDNIYSYELDHRPGG